ncbi:hypothetical protein SeMB42_g01830 [Synchytrium endobioticum]|uniref:Anaphase-promoting complex subunit 4 WD40 domain-containing protein n=1 Tax=Synchytrium endobioticum TaxID=286115 RepID=A0A507DJI1_9FUNG|nr:hypothetical protein SeMB42_g01830 [Synchytrium endobioticum]
MALPFLSQSHIYGLNARTAAPIHRLSNNAGQDIVLCYSAASQIVVHNLETRSQKFVPIGTDGEVVTALGVSSAGTHAAVALSSTNASTNGPPSSIVVCDLTTMRKKKLLHGDDSVKVCIHI